MMEHASVRNLEQIQESEGDSRTPRAVTVLLVALGGACVVFAGLALGGRRSAPTVQKVDPLGDLVTAQAKIGQPVVQRSTDLSTKDVTFPGILSDEGSPTTALAAVKGNSAAAQAQAQAPALVPVVPKAEPNAAVAFNAGAPAPAPMPMPPPGLEGAPAAPPPPTDRLPVVPLPAQHVLAASPVITRPRDTLTRAANDAAQVATSEAQPAASGHEGGYQLQVSSFRTQGEADQFATELRARGHKAYTVEAHVPGRGTWYRVRIGPFTSQHAAAAYRSGFEGREHVVPFIVPPASK
jgi:DedD protein